MRFPVNLGVGFEGEGNKQVRFPVNLGELKGCALHKKSHQ